MRIYHRYLGFFLAGIMTVYALSGIVLIFRDTDNFKIARKVDITVPPNLTEKELKKTLDLSKLEVAKEESGIYYFKEGTYDLATGKAIYTVMELPYVLDKMTHLHKAKSAEPLYILNIFFGLSLLFFVVSSFWMFIPSTSVFRKGMLFVAAGVVLTLVLLFV
jgi:uncharacterized iron-regulated membrane protein